MTFLELSATRGLITEALRDEGWPTSGTVVDDGGGGGTVTQVAGGTVACRIDALGGGEAEVASRISDRSSHVITLAPGLSVTTESDFVIAGRGTFEVTAVREHTGELAHMFEVVES